MARNRIFVWAEMLENAINRSRYGTAPRPLTNEDFDMWATELDSPPRPVLQNKEHIILAIKRVNRYRWNQYRRNYRWVQKQMKKFGLNPEDARWLL